MFPRPIRVLHISAVETNNYYLNNLVDYTDTNDVCIAAVTTGADRGFISELGRRGVRGFALECHGKRNLPQALYKLTRLAGSFAWRRTASCSGGSATMPLSTSGS